MDEIKWWLVEGVMVEVEDSSGLIDIWRLNKPIIKNIKEGVLKDKITPVGVPFDCMPEWAEKIQFWKGEGDKYWRAVFLLNHVERECEECFIRDCPEEWEGKIFEITDELRGLLND